MSKGVKPNLYLLVACEMSNILKGGKKLKCININI